MAHTIKAENLSKLRCQKCGEKPSLTLTTGKKGMVVLAKCKCHAAVLWVEVEDYKAWHQKEFGYELKDKDNGR